VTLSKAEVTGNIARPYEPNAIERFPGSRREVHRQSAAVVCGRALDCDGANRPQTGGRLGAVVFLGRRMIALRRTGTYNKSS
jgi:hypothetical protein